VGRLRRFVQNEPEAQPVLGTVGFGPCTCGTELGRGPRSFLRDSKELLLMFVRSAYRTVIFLLLTSFVSGCAGHGTILPFSVANASSRKETATATFPTKGDVYVAYSNNVAVYGPEGASLLATISSGRDVPGALTFDRFGALYVANQRPGPLFYLAGAVRIYSPGSVSYKNAVSKDVRCPLALAYHRSLYVLNANATVTVYNPSSGALQLRISKGISLVPTAMIFDRLGNLYVANNTSASNVAWSGTVTVYSPKSVSPMRTLVVKGHAPTALAVDSHNNLYVGTTYYPPYVNSSSFGVPNGFVREYASEGTKTLRTIGIGLPVSSLAVDTSDNVYVAENTDSFTSSSSGVTLYMGAVGVYSPKSAYPLRTIVMNQPRFLALDGPGNLYAADCTDDTCGSYVVRVVKAHSTKVIRSITISGTPSAIATEP
jgi:hypothetical protein